MREARRDADLAQESLGAHRRRELRPQHFDRDLAAVLFLLGEIYRRHAPRTELTLDEIAGSERTTRMGDRGSGHVVKYVWRGKVSHVAERNRSVTAHCPPLWTEAHVPLTGPFARAER